MSLLTKNLFARKLIMAFTWFAADLQMLSANMQIKQKQPLRGVPRKKCSEHVQQIHGTTPMPKHGFNDVAKQLY